MILRPAPQGPRGFEAYRFGLHDEDPIDARRAYDGLGQTDRDGRATLRLALPVAPTSTRPLEARLIARLVEAGGRPVERALTLPVSERKRLIGVRPTFGASIGEGETAGFDVVVLGEDGRQAALQGSDGNSRASRRGFNGTAPTGAGPSRASPPRAASPTAGSMRAPTRRPGSRPGSSGAATGSK